MKKIYILITLLVFVVGCGDKKLKPVEIDPVSEAPVITLFKQSLPIAQKVLAKAYKRISPKIGLSHMSDLKGISFRNEFVFEEGTLPFIEYRFDKPYIIKRIHLQKSGFVVDGKAEMSNIKKFEIVFFAAEKSPVHTSQLDEDTSSIEDFHNIEASGFILKTHSVYTSKDEKLDAKDVIAAFDARISVEVIDVNHVYDIIAPVLTQRDSSTSNEELLKTIALLNTALFKRLKAQRSDFNLPKESVLYLPDDADMNYAVAYTQEIFQTGKYKTIDGIYKIHIFNEEAEFDSKGKIRHKKHKINVKKTNRNLKTTTQLPSHKEFIDFSEGL
ncbi:MAG TPA: hypothetical protein EYO73_01020 [Sulfurimonas sp.]|nr:hypothetical protein [Sulfurimonas sp.]